MACRIENRLGPVSHLGSGTVAAGDGQAALVITCRHVFAEGTGQVTVTRGGRDYPAKLLGIARHADIAALEITDPTARRLTIAPVQAIEAKLIGFGGTDRPWKETGRLVDQSGGTVFYDFHPQDGDSGGGVFDMEGRLMGVAWGTTGDAGAVVSLVDLKEALDSPTLKRFKQPTTSKGSEEMTSTMTSVLLAGILAQAPPMPQKSAPLAVPSPQVQTYAPQVQQFDIPISVRVRVIPEVDVQAVAPQPRVYAAPQTSYAAPPVTYGSCYSSSYSGSYGVVQSYAEPVYRQAVYRPSVGVRGVLPYEYSGETFASICGPFGCSPTGFAGLGKGKTHLKIKNSFNATDRHFGLFGR